ncbi:putative transposase [Bdellovibrio bacteriovorus W]|nr:putative transposase [Bdellovibrio bacteriovorus W]
MKGKTIIGAAILAASISAKANIQSKSKLSSKAHTATNSTAMSRPTNSTSASLQRPSKTSDVKFYGQIRMEGMQYFSAVPESPQLSYSQLLSARLSLIKETSWVDFMGDVSGGTFFTRGQSHYIVHEAFASTHGKGPNKLYLGRKKMDWSDMDRRWQLGLWQPQFAMDTLRPEEQGLTGLFFQSNNKNWEVLGFITPIFIPSMGPEIREEGGGLVADSRWYRAPSRDYDFNSRINNINYALDIPETAKLVGNGAVGAMGRLGQKEKGPWVSVSAGYLPVNELILKRQNFKDVSQDRVDVTVSPEVTYHSLYSADVGYSWERVKVTASALHDTPMQKSVDQDWSIQQLKPLTAFSAAVDFPVHNLWKNTLVCQVQYLKVEGGGIVDVLADGQPDDFTLFDQRLKFTNALSLRVEGQLAAIKTRPVVTRIKYLYDYDQRGSLLNTEFLYYPNQKWAVVMGSDILGVQDENYKTSSFLNQYRANDRVYGGMTYVF